MRPDPASLTATELAARAGVEPETVLRYAGLGILEPEEGAYRARDVARIRLAGSCERGGIPVDDRRAVRAAGFRAA